MLREVRRRRKTAATSLAVISEYAQVLLSDVRVHAIPRAKRLRAEPTCKHWLAIVLNRFRDVVSPVKSIRLVGERLQVNEKKASFSAI